MTRRTALLLGLVFVAIAAGTGAIIAGHPGWIAGVDEAWNLEMGEWRSWPPLVGGALGMNFLGGGWVATFVTPLVVAALGAMRRGWRGGAFVLIAFVVSAGAVQIVKNALGRARPQDLLIASDFGSFPSGHTANAATLGVVLWFLFPSIGVAVGGFVWTVAMGFSRTVLSVHWFSDTVGGALLGAGMALLTAAVLWSWARGGAGRADRAHAPSGDAVSPPPRSLG